MTGSSTDRDERVARALQEQYRREAVSATNNGSGGSNRTRTLPSTSAPSSRINSNNIVPPSRASHTTRTPKQKKTNGGSSSTPDTALSSTPSPLKNNKNKRSDSNCSSGTAKTSPRSTPSSSPRSSPRNFLYTTVVDTTKNDEVVARKLEQELRDAELASSLARTHNSSTGGNRNIFATLPSITTSTSQQQKQKRSSKGRRSRASPSQQQSFSNNNKNDDCKSKTLYYGTRLTITILVVSIIFVVYVTIFGPQSSSGLDPSSWLPGYPEADPSLGSVGEHNTWKPLSGQEPNTGLSLQILNNLVQDSDWNDYLTSSIYEWNNGKPDAVTLNIRSITHDPECRAVRRAMKVCNANYGPTDWRGVNQILLQDEYIITSLAKMNDYYLEGTNRAQKQYTMCHELGHGLGLGHSDENFHNKDLGNCMDYTERPENNMHPDTSNFETLQELYGNVNGNLRMERNAGGGGGRRAEVGEDGDDDEWMMREDDEFELYASYLLDPIELASSYQTMSDDNEDFEHNEMNSNGGVGSWRLLHKTETVEHHERKLGNGYSIHTSILLA